MTTKKLIKTAIIAACLPLAFASCKKDFVCTCKSTNALGGETTETYPLENQTRLDAVENCENYEADNAFVTRNCNL